MSRSIFRKVIVALAIATAAVGFAPAAAQASPGVPRGAFILTVSEGTTPYLGEPVLLTCPPIPLATHPDPAGACAAIAAAGGDFNQLPVDPAVLCPAIYAPVTATADGRWGGRKVHWTKTFENSCLLYVETHPVF